MVSFRRKRRRKKEMKDGRKTKNSTAICELDCVSWPSIAVSLNLGQESVANYCELCLMACIANDTLPS